VFANLSLIGPQTSGTRRPWPTFGIEGEVLSLEWRIGFKADGRAAIAQVEQRDLPGTNRTTLESQVIEIDWAEVLTVAAVLPFKVD